MDYCEGGDMSRLLEKKQRLEEKVVRMYAAEILLGI
jgi:serine/threonine protein kinase